MWGITRSSSQLTEADESDLKSAVRYLQLQIGEMRDFLETQLLLQRELLDRLASGPESSTAVAPTFRVCKGTGITGQSSGSLAPIEEGHEAESGVDSRGTEAAERPEAAESPAERAERGPKRQELGRPVSGDSNGSAHARAQLQLNNLQARHLRTTTRAAQEQFQKRRFRMCMKEIVFSPMFSLVITLLILLNVVLLGVEVDVSASMQLDEVPAWFGTLNAIIVLAFVLELMMKIFVLGCREFWCGTECGWNCFDFMIVSASVFDLAVDVIASLMSASLDTGHLRLMRSIRVARAIRGVRVVRIFRYITALRTLALSIISTMSSLFWTLALLILVFYLFAVVITQLVLDYCRHSGSDVVCPDLLWKFWGSVPESMLTLFMAITNGLSWDDAIRPLREASYVAVALVILYVTIAVFAILNVVTGVFCNTAIESAHADKEVATIKQVRSKDQQVEALKQVFMEMNSTSKHKNSVTFEEMADAISTGELASFMEAMGISTDDIWTLYTLLDADKDGRIHLDEFVSGCMQLHGPAKSLQLAKMSFENKSAREEIKQMTKDLSELRRLLKFNKTSQATNLKESF